MEDKFEGKSRAYVEGYTRAQEIESGVVDFDQSQCGSSAEKCDVLNPYSAPSKLWYDWREGFEEGQGDSATSEVYEEGSRARQHGFKYQDNPYKNDPKKKAEWTRGFHDTILTPDGAEHLKERLASEKK